MVKSTAVVRVRIPRELEQILRESARKHDLTVSDYLRDRIDPIGNYPVRHYRRKKSRSVSLGESLEDASKRLAEFYD